MATHDDGTTAEANGITGEAAAAHRAKRFVGAVEASGYESANADEWRVTTCGMEDTAVVCVDGFGWFAPGPHPNDYGLNIRGVYGGDETTRVYLTLQR